MLKTFSVALSAIALAVCSTTAQADFEVKISGMHLCCGACSNAVKKAVAKVEGVKETVNADKGETSLTGKDKDAVQKAIDAIAEAGFIGKLDKKEVSFKEVKAPKGKVKKLEITDIHNCCGGCADALKEIVGEVKGVKGNNIAAKKTSFVVEGDFAAEDLVKALHDHGFGFKVKE